MADNNPPADAGTVDATPQSPPSQDQLIEDISDLLADPDDDSPDLPETPEEDATADDDPLLQADAEPEVVDPDATPDPDGSEPEIKGGRFAPDSAKVTLDDGTVITVAELKRNNLFQRDYTQKRQVEAEKAKAVEARDAELEQLSQSLNQQREFVSWFAENYLPKQPTPPTDPTDYAGEIEYNRQLRAFNQVQQVLGYFAQTKQAETQQTTEKQKREASERAQQEYTKLVEHIPQLKDDTKRLGFFQTVLAGAQKHYGYSEQELRDITDHRALLVMRDALELRRLKQSAPQAVQQVKARPAMAQPGKRPLPANKQVQARQARTEKLRNSGTFEDGVAALMDFDL